MTGIKHLLFIDYDLCHNFQPNQITSYGNNVTGLKQLQWDDSSPANSVGSSRYFCVRK